MEWFNAVAFYLWRPEGHAFGPDKAALHLWRSVKWWSAALRGLWADSFIAWQFCTDFQESSFPIIAVYQYSAKSCSGNAWLTLGNKGLCWFPASAHRQSMFVWLYQSGECWPCHRDTLQFALSACFCSHQTCRLGQRLQVHPGRTVQCFLLFCLTLTPQELL